MEIKRGGAAVKEHAIEAGIDDDLTRIIAAFGGKSSVKDISIYTPGKLTFINEQPHKVTRVRPGGDGQGQTTKQAIQIAQQQGIQGKYK